MPVIINSNVTTPTLDNGNIIKKINKTPIKKKISTTISDTASPIEKLKQKNKLIKSKQQQQQQKPTIGETMQNILNNKKTLKNNIDNEEDDDDDDDQINNSSNNIEKIKKEQEKIKNKEETEKLNIKKREVNSAISNEAKPLFHRMIKFKEAEIQDDSNDQLKKKYKPINKLNNDISSSKKLADLSKAKIEAKKKQQQIDKEDEDEDEDDDNILAKPKKVIFSVDQLSKLMEWKSVQRIGSGLNNVGNTCFMNSVIQCLTYTVPLANFMMSREHSRQCKISGFCIFCSLETQILQNHKCGGGKSVTPKEIASNIRKIAPTFRIGRQEDSHEFIRFMIESLQKVCLSKFPKGSISHRDTMTTVIGSIFGGYLRSQVKCSQCQYESNTYDPFMDLCVDINQADSLTKGLTNFVKSEILDGSNKYKCSKCKKLVKAQKRLQIHIAPPILTCQIKRFSFLGSYGGKINRQVQFDQTLNLSPFMTQPNNHSIYDLYAVLVHLGGSTSSGHYYCYVKGSNGIWYNMDDSSVSQVSLNTVLSQKAYMLFYSKRNIDQSINTNTVPISNTIGTKRKLVENDDADEIVGEKEKQDKPNSTTITTITTTITTTTTSTPTSTKTDEKQKIKKQKTSTTTIPTPTKPTTTNNNKNNNTSTKIETTITTTPTILPTTATTIITKKVSPQLKSSSSPTPSPKMKSISLGNDEIIDRQTLKNQDSDHESEEEEEDNYSDSDESSLSGPSSESDNGGVSPSLISTVLTPKITKQSTIINIHNQSKKEKKATEKQEKQQEQNKEDEGLDWESIRIPQQSSIDDKKRLKSINTSKQNKENAKLNPENGQFNFNVGAWDTEDIGSEFKDARKELLNDELLKEVNHEKDEHNKHFDLGRTKKIKVKKHLSQHEPNQFNQKALQLKQRKENELKYGNDRSSKFTNKSIKKQQSKNSNRPKKFTG
ncbi:hypothetical protein RB653_001916 [Dictyostelium firmibasis]|uniref:Ubiquitin carboxyl-terminal hydrolase n=1 Tax=Dictyostelium firmibasis TaxID=79012 RepID=A0AAN7YMK6_9MYCE